MKRIKLVHPDFSGEIKTDRTGCRGIVIKESRILLCWFSKRKNFIIPGGGVEVDESLEECVIREIKEETGYIVKPIREYLEIEEFFDSMRFLNHYFICEVISNKGETNLTENEKKQGMNTEWVDIDRAYKTFSAYENYSKDHPETSGLYKREFLALEEYFNNIL